jgi:hypothetical protein
LISLRLGRGRKGRSMKLPEIRFTVRRLMIAVVVAALLMAFANMIRSIRDDRRTTMRPSSNSGSPAAAARTDSTPPHARVTQLQIHVSPLSRSQLDGFARRTPQWPRDQDFVPRI